MGVLLRENIGALSKTGATTLQLAPSEFYAGGRVFKNTNFVSCDLSTNGLGGLDVGSLSAFSVYYIYGVNDGVSQGLICSLNANGPSGFISFRELGKFVSDDLSQVSDPADKGKQFEQFIQFDVGNAFGGTDIYIRRYVNKLVKGSYLLDAQDSAANATQVTAKHKCRVQATMHDQGSGGGGQFGISINVSNVAQIYNNVPQAERQGKQGADAVSGNDYESQNIDVDLINGDILRPHTNGASTVANPGNNAYLVCRVIAKYVDIV